MENMKGPESSSLEGEDLISRSSGGQTWKEERLADEQKMSK